MIWLYMYPHVLTCWKFIFFAGTCINFSNIASVLQVTNVHAPPTYVLTLWCEMLPDNLLFWSSKEFCAFPGVTAECTESTRKSMCLADIPQVLRVGSICSVCGNFTRKWISFKHHRIFKSYSSDWIKNFNIFAWLMNDFHQNLLFSEFLTGI